MPQTDDGDHPELMVTPRYLAGGGNPAWITVPLHHAYGWRLTHDLLRSRITLHAPGHRAALHLASGSQEPCWRIRHAPAPGIPAWNATFTARAPVEIIAAVTDALTAPAGDDLPFAPLRRALWPPVEDGSFQGQRSPDGYARLGYTGDAATGFWCASAALEDSPQGRVWEAVFDSATPPVFVAAFAHALADAAPLPRAAADVPARCRAHTSTTRTGPRPHGADERLAARIAALQHTGSTAPSPPPPQPSAQRRPPPRPR
ncbi:DUF317 domain-containing protein [Streptomyces sp. NPDC057654]|uniref:DUF317 domain-containing protein n=1 Tax=Streptomyces sp. NPDC057654 TaxID=3346196 RepID=UPI00368970F1